jgi:hypothetical protein
VGYRAGEGTVVIRSLTEQVCGRRDARLTRRPVPGLTSIVRGHRPDVQIAPVRDELMYQAFVPRGPAVPSPNPLFLVARQSQLDFCYPVESRTCGGLGSVQGSIAIGWT